MQWGVVVLWGGLIRIGAGSAKGRKALRAAMAAGLAGSMAMQLVLLAADGRLAPETALPFHLCGMFGILSIFMLWHTPAPLWEASVYLGAPAALCALLFPAVMPSSHPLLMRLAFFQLHALIVLTPVFLFTAGKPLPTSPRRTLLLGNGYLLFVSAVNACIGSNYLFLRAAPAGTPLAWLFQRGNATYVCALEMLCMLLFSCLQGVCCYVQQRRPWPIAENS